MNFWNYINEQQKTESYQTLADVFSENCGELFTGLVDEGFEAQASRYPDLRLISDYITEKGHNIDEYTNAKAATVVLMSMTEGNVQDVSFGDGFFNPEVTPDFDLLECADRIMSSSELTVGPDIVRSLEAYYEGNKEAIEAIEALNKGVQEGNKNIEEKEINNIKESAEEIKDSTKTIKDSILEERAKLKELSHEYRQEAYGNMVKRYAPELYREGEELGLLKIGVKILEDRLNKMTQAISSVKDNIHDSKVLDELSKGLATISRDSNEKLLNNMNNRTMAICHRYDEVVSKLDDAKEQRKCIELQNREKALDRAMKKLEKKLKGPSLTHFRNRFSEQGRAINDNIQGYIDREARAYKNEFMSNKTDDWKRDPEKGSSNVFAKMIRKDRSFLYDQEKGIDKLSKKITRLEKKKTKIFGRLEKAQSKIEKYLTGLNKSIEKIHAVKEPTKEATLNDFEKDLRNVATPGIDTPNKVKEIDKGQEI